MKLHIFDVDFTIVSCSTVRAFIFRGLREGLIGPSIGFYAPLLFLRYGVKAKPERADERAYPFLTGVARADLEALSRALFEEVLRRRIDVAVAGRIETILSFRRQGDHRLFFLRNHTRTPRPASRDFGYCGERLEFLDGVATGRVSGEPAFGEGKRSRVLAYLRTIGAEPEECAFYSDSRRDLPLLREVGEAVAVNPDGRLRRIARESGWEIMDTKKAGMDEHHA